MVSLRNYLKETADKARNMYAYTMPRMLTV